jgi:branched-chain amino acid transport system substrate-binding protein
MSYPSAISSFGSGAALAQVSVPSHHKGASAADLAKAKVIGLANAGGDTINSIKQASEFGIVAGGQRREHLSAGVHRQAHDD